MLKRLGKSIPWLLVFAIFVVVAATRWREARQPDARPAAPLELIGSVRGPASTADGLTSRIKEMETRLAANAEDSAAKIILSEALLRQARVTGNAAHAAHAEQLVREALRDDPSDYNAQRLLGLVLLSLHRFDEAIAAADQAKAMRPDDAWNWGVRGDGLLELGRYDEAFKSFQQMMDMRPNAASYARAAYALELQGNLDAALEAMRRAANSTSPRDAEGLAWTTVQIGDLLFRLDRLPEAEREYARANQIFPNHPFAVLAMARISAARGDDDRAIVLARQVLDRTPSVAVAALIGDLHARNNRSGDAENFYAIAETIGREAKASDESLAGFLAERGRKTAEAVTLAEQTAKRRQDVRTLDALAWAYFRAGRVNDAVLASERALRVGTREKHIVLHGAAIKAAMGEGVAARELAKRASARDPDFDVLAGPEVARLAGIATPLVAMSERSATAR